MDPVGSSKVKPKIRVFLLDDHEIVRRGVQELLESESDIEVIARARNGDEALDLVRTHRPHVLLTDIEMPGKSGLEVADLIRQEALPTRVVILTTFARAGYLRRALDAGASGYLLKDSPAEQLANAIRRVHAGGRAVDPELAAEAWGEPDPLTDRERQVLRRAGEGQATGESAEALHLSEGTVRNYLSEAISKLGAQNRVEAARIAREKGWL
jgi:two-component system response regulator DesR